MRERIALVKAELDFISGQYERTSEVESRQSPSSPKSFSQSCDQQDEFAKYARVSNSGHRPIPRSMGSMETAGIVPARLSTVNILIALIAAAFGTFGGIISSRHLESKRIMEDRTLAALEKFITKREGTFPKVEELKPQFEVRSNSGPTTNESKNDAAQSDRKMTQSKAEGIEKNIQVIPPEMHSYISKTDYLAGVDRHGEGPHKVMISLRFMGEPVGSGKHPDTDFRGKIRVQTAPLHRMPHTVCAFLDMVAQGLYNGVKFNIMTSRGTLAVDTKSKFHVALEDKVKKRFHEAGRLPALVLEEQGDSIPSDAFCIGFMDKGPGIFLSAKQSGARHYESGPCFAQVVDGFDILEKIAAIKPGKLRDPIMISFARVENE